MAFKAAIGAKILNQTRRISLNRTSVSLFLNQKKLTTPIPKSGCENKIITNIRDFCSGKRIKSIDHQINSPHDKNPSSSSTSLVTEKTQESLPETDLQAISDSRSTNTVFGSTVIDGSTGEWLTLNRMMNTYPSVRRFTAIGMGGDDFVKSMLVAVESVIQQPVPQDHVKQRVSSGGKYVSVNIGPVRVVSREQVQAVYNAMRSDKRMKFFL